MRIAINRELAFAASLDEANRAMRLGGRHTWSEGDYAIAVATLNRLWPPCKHKIDPGECWLCSEKSAASNEIRAVTFRKAPRSRGEAASNLLLDLSGEE